MKTACIIILLTVFGFSLTLSAQVPGDLPEPPNTTTTPIYLPPPSGPAIDKNNWVLDSALSDEFNDTTIDNDTIFIYQDMCDADTIHQHWSSLFPNWIWKGGVLEQDGHLILRNQRNNNNISPCNYTGFPFSNGVVQTKDTAYLYGYYEISVKMPGFIDSAGHPMGLGFYPTFWTYYATKDSVRSAYTCCYNINSGGCCPYNHYCVATHDELDISETDGYQYANADATVYGVWHQYGAIDPCFLGKAIEGDIVSPDPLFEAYHKIGLEMLSDRIYFYLDDQPYGWELLDPLFTSMLPNAYNQMHKMQVVLSFGIDGNVYNYYDHNTKSYPYQSIINSYPYSNADSTSSATSMFVDYFHYYVLKYDCGTDVTIPDSSTFSTFTSGVIGVKHTITFDGSDVNNIDLSSTDNFTFRADSGITIKPPFNAPSGSILNLIITPCDPH